MAQQAASGPTVAPAAAPAGTAPALEMRAISKRFPGGVLANDGISLELRAGEIHALLGENGAGKSTLMNILYGLLTPDSGEILLDGHAATIKSPSDAIARGIGMVHQHFMLVPVFSVAENIVLGNETLGRFSFLDRRGAEGRIRELGRRFGFHVDPNALVGTLSVGEQQRIEILKALYRGARVLILDEPTAVLTPQETAEIFTVLRGLAAGGTSVVFISHKLYEVLELADRITVIRRGRVVGQADPATATEQELATMMVGREVSLSVDKPPAHAGDVVLSVSGLRVADDRGTDVVHDFDLEIRGGEIFGIAGVAGNGQAELVEALVGLRRPRAGEVRLAGKRVTGLSPRRMDELGVAYIPADRQLFGLVLPYPVEDNLVLRQYNREPYSRWGLLNGGAIERRGQQLLDEYDIRAPSASVPTSTLSGGNQQKIIIAREFSRDVTLLVADQPTRGLDIGSIEFVHRQIVAKRDAGSAVLLASAELDEVLEVADRVGVMFRGRLVAMVNEGELSKEQIGLLMATGTLERPTAPEETAA